MTVPSREGRTLAANRRADRALATLAGEWRALRESAGLSQAGVAAAAGVSRRTYGRIEHGPRDIGVRRAVAISAVLGADLVVRLYPAGPPIRDAGHVALLARFEKRLSATCTIRHETPISSPGDQRAWDRRLDGPVSIGVEAETRLRDIQALERSLNLKLRDSGVARIVLVVGATRHNREVLQAALLALRATLPLSTAEVLRALGEGRDPGANGIVVV